MPVQDESAVKGTGPICGAFVVGLERIDKVVCVLFGEIFDAGTVNEQGERGGSCNVATEAWNMWVRFVSVWGKVANELAEENDSCLFEAIHTALYLKVY